MKCDGYRKWISDRMDGRLPARRPERLEEHLSTCSACRDYDRDLERIRSGVRKKKREVSDVDFRDFTSRLRHRLGEEAKRRPAPGPPRLKWAWALVPLLAAVLTAVWIFRPAGGSAVPAGMILSHQEALDRIDSELGDDAELRALFNSMILAQIRETFSLSEIEAGIGTDYSNPLLYGEEWPPLEGDSENEKKING